MQLKAGGWIGSETLDFDPTAQNVRKRRGSGERRPTAAAGGEWRRDSPAIPNPGLWGTVRRAEGIYATRAGGRSELERRF
jgi:hypothetical protein